MPEDYVGVCKQCWKSFNSSAVNMDIHWTLLNVIVDSSSFLIYILTFVCWSRTPGCISDSSLPQLAQTFCFGILHILSNSSQPESTPFPPHKHDTSDTFDSFEIKRSCLKSARRAAGRCNKWLPLFCIIECKTGREKIKRRLWAWLTGSVLISFQV